MEDHGAPRVLSHMERAIAHTLLTVPSLPCPDECLDFAALDHFGPCRRPSSLADRKMQEQALVDEEVARCLADRTKAAADDGGLAQARKPIRKVKAALLSPQH